MYPLEYRGLFQRSVFRIDEESDEGAASSMDRSSISDHPNSHGIESSISDFSLELAPL
jgi:hypothetical protein